VCGWKIHTTLVFFYQQDNEFSPAFKKAPFWNMHKLPQLTLPQTPFKTEPVVEGL
jgi:hypothetical protein